ncbi:MAG: acyltransferase family protein [Aliishimia sp.]
MMQHQRYHGLDALRAFAMLLGLVLHASQVYMRPDFLNLFAPWVTTPAPAATALTDMTAIWIHLWRMPAFFLLAGFFAQMMLERRGTWAFLKDRFVRIFLVLILADAAYAAWRGYPFGTLAHLWFLWILTVLCIVAPFTARIARPWLFERLWRILLIIPPMALLGLWNRNNVWQDVPNTFWDPQFSAFAMYGAYFILGQTLWAGRAVLGWFARFEVFVPLIVVGFAAHGLLGAYYFAPMPEIVRQTGITVTSLSLVFGLVGLAERMIQRPYRAVTLGIEMAYFIYIIHLYIVYELSAWAVQAGWPQSVAIVVVSCAGLGISAVLYLLLARYTPLNWLLAGYKNSWFKWPFGPNGHRSKAQDNKAHGSSKCTSDA